MGQFNPDIHHRRSIRMPTFDYASEGAYFVTMCVLNRECLFGEIKDGEMGLNDLGNLVRMWSMRLPGKFPNMEIDPSFIIMPNHVHCIIWIHDPVGADLCVRPIQGNDQLIPMVDTSETRTFDPDPGEGTHMGVPLPKIIQWFKTMTTNSYFQYRREHSLEFGGPLWQRNYYERIIRSESELYAVRRYIQDNPLKWGTDPERSVKSMVDE
jgi:REP element-mobilizing transposase RayT